MTFKLKLIKRHFFKMEDELLCEFTSEFIPRVGDYLFRQETSLVKVKRVVVNLAGEPSVVRVFVKSGYPF